MPPSDALSILKHKAPVTGRCLGLLVTDGADAATLAALRDEAEKAGASVKIIAPRVGGATLSDGRHLPADEKLDGAPSVLFDAVALVLSDDAAHQLTREKAALDFVSDAFAHCKAIGHTTAAQPLLDKAGVQSDGFILDLSQGARPLIDKLSSRDWSREPKVKIPL